jgi:hypothetical protein
MSDHVAPVRLVLTQIYICVDNVRFCSQHVLKEALAPHTAGTEDESALKCLHISRHRLVCGAARLCPARNRQHSLNSLMTALPYSSTMLYSSLLAQANDESSLVSILAGVPMETSWLRHHMPRHTAVGGASRPPPVRRLSVGDGTGGGRAAWGSSYHLGDSFGRGHFGEVSLPTAPSPA